MILNDTVLLLEWTILSKEWEYFLIGVKYLDFDDELLIGDNKRSGTNTRMVGGGGRIIRSDRVEFISQTNQTRVEIIRDQLRASCQFQVYSVNSKGISLPSESSEVLKVPRSLLSVNLLQQKRPVTTIGGFWSYWPCLYLHLL